MIYQNIVEAIGNTPILKIDPKVHGLKNIELYAKLEYMNPFGSVKDRTAKALLYDALEDAIKNNKKVIEFSSSNTAKALAVLCSINGLKYKTYSNRIKVSELLCWLFRDCRYNRRRWIVSTREKSEYSGNWHRCRRVQPCARRKKH